VRERASYQHLQSERENVCVCVRERASERESVGEKGRARVTCKANVCERERAKETCRAADRERVCVCVSAHVSKKERARETCIARESV